MTLSYEKAIDLALLELEDARSKISIEIARYPAPISGCDAQFTHLLSDRSRIANAIHAIKAQPFIPTTRQLDPITSLDAG